MILLIDKKNENKNILRRKFSRYEVIETGLDNDDLELLISLYLEPEFKVKKVTNEKTKVL
jgi:hypothetical protein